MHSFIFIHAADLHLGAPFKGLDSSAAEIYPLAEASFAALANLEKLCLERGAAFLILAGDVYDDANGVLRAHFALRDMFARLGEAGVRVFFAHGNHDPYKTGRLPVAWPDNVTVFSPEVSTECVMREGAPIALVQGVSHANAAETANLSLKFTPYAPGAEGAAAGPFPALSGETPAAIPADIFQIAVLHCAVGGAGEGHAPYAPCTLTDLAGAGFDYWALGHVHQGGILSEKPWIVYPGSFQGMHVNETGAHGAVAVTVTDGAARVEPVNLAPVAWRKVAADVSDVETVDALENTITEALDNAAASFAGAGTVPEGTAGPETKALFCRVILRGRTELHSMLQKRAELTALLERLRSEYSGPVSVWLKDIIAETKPPRDAAALLERSDLVGEVSRIAAEPALAADIVAASLMPLRNHQKVKKALAGSEIFAMNDTDAATLANSAASLLVSLLEDE